MHGHSTSLFRSLFRFSLPLLSAGLIFTGVFLVSRHYLNRMNDPELIEFSDQGLASCEKMYYFPVHPPHLCSYSSQHHDYPATDIFAPEGTTAVAVTSGVIDELNRKDSWNEFVDDPATRGGLFISIIGDDQVRYYSSHLSELIAGLDPGMRVHAGQVIGYVGRTGNARGTPPHLHFGLSAPSGGWEKRRGEYSPFPYLNLWKDGHSVTPRHPDDSVSESSVSGSR